MIKTVVKIMKCSDGSEQWTYNDGSKEVKDAKWLAYVERARKRELREWKKMTEKVHLTTGRVIG